VKRIGLKYCGGCNPSYERVKYVEALRGAAGGRIEWVTAEEGGFSSLLIVCGCDKQCVEMAQYRKAGCHVVRVKDGHRAPGEILSQLLEGEHD
jgi:hypothetical protein